MACIWMYLESVDVSRTPIEFAPIHQDFTLTFEEHSMTLTKVQIVESLFAKNILTKKESAQIIQTFFELIKRSLRNGETALTSGFGKFSVKEKYERNGENPQTRKPMMLAPGKVVRFKHSGVLRAAMNGEVD